MTKVRRFLDEYMHQVVSYGGLPVRRGLMILDLQSIGIPVESRNHWIHGSERRELDCEPIAETLEELHALMGDAR